VLTKPRSDEALAEEFRRRRDRDALSELISRYDQRITAFLLKLLRDPHQAQEASQETFLRMLRGLDGYRADLPFRPWLYRIALNAARSLRTREAEQARRERTAALSRPEKDTAVNPAEKALRKEVESSVDRLPETQKEAILLHYFQGLSHSEVASALEIPAGTVATRIHGGLESLRGRLAALGLAVAAGALEELLGAGNVEAAPSSLRAAVLAETAGAASGNSAPLGLMKGLLVANPTLSSKIAVLVLCVAGGSVLGYAVRSSQERHEPETASALPRRAPSVPVLAGRDESLAVLPVRPPPAAAARTTSAPALPEERKKTKLQKAASLLARMLQASGKGPQSTLRVPPQEAGELVALMSDPEITALMENAGQLKWEHAGEFMVALVEELVPDLTDPQRARLQDALANIVGQTKTLTGQSSTSVERKLLEIRQGRDFFEQVGAILTPEQQSGLGPLQLFGVSSVPSRLLQPGSLEGIITEVLDLWSQNLAPLSAEDRSRLGVAAGEYAARLRAIQTDLESRYGSSILKTLSSPPMTRLAASFGTEAAPARPSSTDAVPDPSLTLKQLDAYGRLLELERDQREVLAALLPGQAEAIRNAEPYVPLLESGPKPGFLGVSGSDAPGGGARVLRVVENTAASGAGIRAGDVIVEVNGEPIADYPALVARIRDAGQGSELQIKLRREGVEFLQGVRLSTPPK